METPNGLLEDRGDPRMLESLVKQARILPLPIKGMFSGKTGLSPLVGWPLASLVDDDSEMLGVPLFL